MSGKHTILLAAITMLSVFGLLTAVEGNLPKEKTSINVGAADGQTSLKIIGDEEDTIFFADSYEYIAMFGNPQFWDDEKNMAFDVNQDGSDEEFVIASDRKEGLLLEGSTRRNGSRNTMNFWSDNMFTLLRKDEGRQEQIVKAKDFLTGDFAELLWLLKEGSYIVKGRCNLDDDYVQISCCDIDEDGMKEVLVSVGNKKDENVTAIYEYSQKGKKPFTYQGAISCDTAVEYRGNGVFWAYNGNSGNGQHDRYLYENGNVKKYLTKDKRNAEIN